MPRGAGGSVDRFEATFQYAPVGIAHVAPDGSFIDVNPRFVEITGHSREALLEHGFQRITHPDDLDSDLANVDSLLVGDRDRYTMEKRYVRPDGSLVWVMLTVALIRDAQRRPDFFVSVIEDVSEVKRARAEATRDPLTGLLNRRGFQQRFDQERMRCRETGLEMALAYVDLDNFKQLNDAHGHAAGDRFLVEAARALAGQLRPGDRLARFGGDEMVLLMPRTSATERDAIVARLRDALDMVEVAPGWSLGGSIGAISIAPDDPRPDQELIAAADDAMYQEKRRRRAAR